MATIRGCVALFGYVDSGYLDALGSETGLLTQFAFGGLTGISPGVDQPTGEAQHVAIRSWSVLRYADHLSVGRERQHRHGRRNVEQIPLDLPTIGQPQSSSQDA